MKKLTAFLIGVSLICQGIISNAENMGIKLDGNEIVAEVTPFFADNVVMVPLRAVMEKLGFRVFYNDETQEIFTLKDSEFGNVRVGSSRMEINGAESELDAKVITVNGTAMVPVRFISEMSKKYISYDVGNNSVVIYLKQKPGNDSEFSGIAENELLINPAIENAADDSFGWKKYGYASIEMFEDDSVYGDSCIRIKNRTSRYSGLSQDITKVLNENGPGTYVFTAYLRTYENSPSVGKTYSIIARTQETGAQTKKYAKKNIAISDKWTKVTLKAELDFSGELQDGLLYFEGSDESDLNDYYIDMCSMTKTD